MKKNIILIIIGIIIGGIVFGGVVAYQYSAKDIVYTPSDNKWNVHSVNDAINDLKSKKNIIYETGSFSNYIAYHSQYVCVTVNFKKEYTEEDNARLIMLSVVPNYPIYIGAGSSSKVIGNSKYFCIFNMSGTVSHSTTYTFNWALIKVDE